MGTSLPSLNYENEALALSAYHQWSCPEHQDLNVERGIRGRYYVLERCMRAVIKWDATAQVTFGLGPTALQLPNHRCSL